MAPAASEPERPRRCRHARNPGAERVALHSADRSAVQGRVERVADIHEASAEALLPGHRARCVKRDRPCVPVAEAVRWEMDAPAVTNMPLAVLATGRKLSSPAPPSVSLQTAAPAASTRRIHASMPLGGDLAEPRGDEPAVGELDGGAQAVLLGDRAVSANQVTFAAASSLTSEPSVGTFESAASQVPTISAPPSAVAVTP